MCAMMMLSLAGCGSAAPTDADSAAGAATNEAAENSTEAAGSTGVTIEYAVNYQQDAQSAVMQGIIDDFESETGIHVELTLNGTDHESVMKTRMASGDLPDLWNTHGWSVMRYREFLRPLNDQTWFDDIDDSVKGAVADSEGNVYVLPIGEGTNGIIYNADVLEANGIDASALTDIDAFADA